MEYVKVEISEYLKKFKYKQPKQEEIETFETIIKNEIATKTDHAEEHEKNIIAEILKQAFSYRINTKSKIDWAIYEEGQVSVILEAKALANKKEFPANTTTLESKAFYESILYYLRESELNNNNNIKHIMLFNLENFYIIDAKEYHNIFAKNKEVLKVYKNCDNKQGNNTSTEKFYKDIEKICKELDSKIEFVHFELTNSETLGYVYSLLAPSVLLKHQTTIDANTLNKNFYNELLYILGLEEKKEDGKPIIVHNGVKNTLFDAISQNLNLDKQRDFEAIFRLLTTWNNRVLFLRLLESMLLSFEHFEKPFLELRDFKDLHTLFFEVLAKKEDERDEDLNATFKNIPYLNSSLFDKIELEKNGKEVRLLESKKLKLHQKSILKNSAVELSLLEYLCNFLHAYDFTTTPKDLQDGVKTNHDVLINSAVLGLVFEKLNGYKDGSFYTPSFITSYMCKESIQKIVLNKFKSELGLNAKDINQLQQLILMSIKSNFDFKDECKKLLNSIRICDPAVGSGHFLVSALNELVYMYYELGLLDFQCDMVIDNDEILIKNTQGELFNYKKPKIQNDENHKIQKSMFNLKKQIIENSLFGVDINANSCEITKLRLWIELLKYSYYKELKTYHLETLPNIDINIKCGNSLISYFDVKQSLSNYPSINKKIKEYKHKVKMYKEGEFVKKDELSKDIKILHESFKSFCLSDKYKKQINAFDKKRQEYAKKYDDFLVCDDEDLKQYFGQKSFFKPEFNEKNAKEDFKKLKALHNEIFNLESYNPFEWRFEFPEVLDEKGNFTGFDLVIGNPPYIRHEAIKELKPRISHYKVFVSTADIYTYFYELALNISKPDGEVSFITSNKYTRAKYGEKLRDFILQNAKILNYIELNGIKVFDSATVDTSILSFQNSKSDEYEFAYKSPTTLEQLLDQAHTLSVKSLSKDSFTFGSSDTQALKSKIESIGTPLKEWDITINYGIKTGFNEAFIISKEKRDEILNSTCTKEERVRTEQIIKPLLRGRDIKRYAYQFADIYLINTNNGAKLKENPIAPIDINDYPTIKKHLDNFYPQLEKRQDKGDTPYNLRNCAYLEDFNKPKLVYSDMVRNAQFSYDTQQCVVNDTSFIMIHNSDDRKILFLMAVLNSTFGEYAFKIFYAGGGLGEGGFRYKKAFLENLPIPKPTQIQEDEIVVHVEKILKLKEENKDTTKEEQIIDKLVYELYGLSEDEIKIVEGNFKNEE